MRPRYALLALVVVAVVAATAGAASPRPVPVCQPCSYGFERAATTQNDVPEEIADADASVTDSTATVRLNDDGSALWTIRNELSSPDVVEYFRANPDVLRQVADEAWIIGDADVLSATVTDDDVIVLRYHVPDFATRSNGVLRVDYFREQPGSYTFYELGADRLRLVGPADTRVTTAIPGATVESNEVTATEYRATGDGPFVVFAPADDPLAGAKTHAAIADATGGVFLRNLLVLVVLPGLVVAAGTWAAGALAGREWLAADRKRARRIGGVVGALGLVVALAAALPGDLAVVGRHAPWGVLAGVGAAVCGGAVSARPGWWTLRRLVGLVLAAASLGGLAAVAGPTGGGNVIGGQVPVAGVAALVPLWLLVVGAARDATGWTRGAMFAVPPVGFALAVAATRPLTASGGPMFLLVPVLFVVTALLGLAAGLPLLALGASVPVTEDVEGAPRPPRSGHAAE